MTRYFGFLYTSHAHQGAVYTQTHGTATQSTTGNYPSVQKLTDSLKAQHNADAIELKNIIEFNSEQDMKDFGS